MSDYDIILLIIGIALFVFAIVFILYMVRDANEFIYNSDKMRDWAKDELDRREAERREDGKTTG